MEYGNYILNHTAGQHLERTLGYRYTYYIILPTVYIVKIRCKSGAYIMREERDDFSLYMLLV